MPPEAGAVDFFPKPAARVPGPADAVGDAQGWLEGLAGLLDSRQEVNEAGELVARSPASGGRPEWLSRGERLFEELEQGETAGARPGDRRPAKGASPAVGRSGPKTSKRVATFRHKNTPPSHAPFPRKFGSG